jgi:hypothetical protein
MKEGIEFDWFAADSEGQFAMFATAGSGVAPPFVIAAHAEFDAVSESIPQTEWGTETIWNVYANLGLFVYDWDETLGRYRQIRVPAMPLDAGLRLRLSSIGSLPVFAFSFMSTNTVSESTACKGARRRSLTS